MVIVIYGLKGAPAKVTNGCLQSHRVRFETRGRELIFVARLRSNRSRSESEKLAGNEELGLKGPVVTGIIPEGARSNPGQDEVERKLHGGLIPMLSCKLLG